MLKEIAIDPNAVSEWLTFDSIVQSCGIEFGRLISDFPRFSWKACVYKAASDNPANTPVQLKRFEERLNQTFVWDRKRALFGPVQDWLSRAEQEHAARPFAGIVASSNPHAHMDVAVASDFDRQNTIWWDSPTSVVAPRSAKVLADLARPLFSISHSVSLVDRFFGTESRFTKTLRALTSAAREENPAIRTIELHVGSEKKKPTFKSECMRYLPKFIPGGMELHVRVWRKREQSDKLHARYILTDKGGLAFDVGLDEGPEGETTDIKLLSRDAHRHRWSDFHPVCNNPGSVFDLSDYFVVKA